MADLAAAIRLHRISAVTASQAVPVAAGLRAGRQKRRLVSRFQFGFARRQAARRGADRRPWRPLCRRRCHDVDPALSHPGAVAARRRRRQRARTVTGGLGFDAKVASERLGVASAVKMCRSIMIKGMEAMVIECFTTARAYGVEDAVLASLAETFPCHQLGETGRLFLPARDRTWPAPQRRGPRGRGDRARNRSHAMVGARYGRTPGLGRRSRPIRACSARKARRPLPAAPTGAPKPTASSP